MGGTQGGEEGRVPATQREVMELLLTQQEREEWEAHREERREEYQRLRTE